MRVSCSQSAPENMDFDGFRVEQLHIRGTFLYGQKLCIFGDLTAESWILVVAPQVNIEVLLRWRKIAESICE